MNLVLKNFLHVLSGGHEQSKFGGYKALDNKTSNGNPWVWRWCCDWVYIQPAGSEGNNIQMALLNMWHNFVNLWKRFFYGVQI